MLLFIEHLLSGRQELVFLPDPDTQETKKLGAKTTESVSFHHRHTNIWHKVLEVFVVLSQITTCCLLGDLLAVGLAHASSLSVNFLLSHKYVPIWQKRAEKGLVARVGR